MELIKQPSSQFELLFGSKLLTKNDISVISELKNELVNTLTKTQMFRTRTEMEISVLNEVKHPTAASKYWQALREQGVMFNELIMLSFEYRKKIVEIKILLNEIKHEHNDLEKELLQINIEKEQYILSSMERTAIARIKEIKHWSEIKERESKNISNINLDDVGNHQLISYTKRWIKQNIIMGSNGSPAERQNLMGQLRSGILASIENKLLDEVLEDFPKDVQEKIKSEYGV